MSAETGRTLGSLPGLQSSAGSLHLAATPKEINGIQLDKPGTSNRAQNTAMYRKYSKVGSQMKKSSVTNRGVEAPSETRGPVETGCQALERVMWDAARAGLSVSSKQSSLPGS